MELSAITSHRLFLKHATWEDWQQAEILSTVPDPPEFEDYPPPASASEWTEEEFENTVAKGQYDVLSIFLKDRRLIGFVKAFDFDLVDRKTCECGIEIFQPEDYGKGYGSEALSLFLGYLKNTYPLESVFGLIHPDNKRSLRLFAKLRFESEGLVPDVIDQNVMFERVTFTF